MRSTLWFFVSAIGGMWLLQLPALLGKLGILPGGDAPYTMIAAFGGFTPLIAAIVAARREGPGKVVLLFASLRPQLALLPWYATALVAFPLIHVIGWAVYRASGGTEPGAWLYPPVNAQQVVVMFLLPLAEETGWRGFAMPRLAARFGVERASLIIGLGWAAWHAVMFSLQGMPLNAYMLAMVMLVPASVVFGWLFARSKASLLVAVLAHVGVHLDNPTHALEHSITPFAVFTVSVGVAAAFAAFALSRSRGEVPSIERRA